MQQQGGSQYGVPPPEMPPPMIGIPAAAEAASPINSRPAPQVSIFDDFGGAGLVRGFADEEAGDDGERGGGGGNRWPRQETLALLKIRSDMDGVFRDATLKGPLWEDVSRKLAELGYTRNSKKCKEKFENVHKYYKRTKEGRAGRQDGKSYRFFTQLEALHSGNTAAAALDSTAPPQKPAFSLPALPEPTMAQPPPPPFARIQPPAIAAPPPPSQSLLELSTPAAVVGISFSSNTSSSSSETDGEETEEGGARKRKRDGWPGGSRKMMAFFDGLMKQVMERQEAMQQRFLETIEKREQDRLIREEAWKRQEIARLNREYDLMAQERAMASNRDAAVISFLRKFAGVETNSPLAAEQTVDPPPSSPPLIVKPPPMQIEKNDLFVINPTTSSSEPTAAELADGVCVGGLDAISISPISPSSSSSSRWPKTEVLALIRLRSGLESRYAESGPKGPLWEEISLGMKRLGYSRNSKRCKEKWENINKYFKKVKESNKKRTEDAKTCPYFHELDALYRKKQQFAGQQPPPELAVTPKIGETEIESNKGLMNPIFLRSNEGDNHENRSNGTNLPQIIFGGATNRGNSTAIKKPEYIVRELMTQQNPQHRAGNEYEKLSGGADTVDSDTINHEFDDDEEEDDEENGKLRYEIQFQRQGVVAGNPTGKVATTTATSSSGSFLAMVQ